MTRRIDGSFASSSAIPARPLTQVAEAVGLSHAPCWRRIQRLRSEGYIEREVARLDRDKLGWEVELFVFLKMSPYGRSTIREFRQWIVTHEQVIGTYVLLGNFDIDAPRRRAQHPRL